MTVITTNNQDINSITLNGSIQDDFNTIIIDGAADDLIINGIPQKGLIFDWRLTSNLLLSRGRGTPTFVRNTVANYYTGSAWQEVLANIPAFPADGIQLEAAATNLFLNSATLSTQNVTTTGQSYTVAFEGTGTITFTGTFVGSLVGTGANDRVTKTFTATGGTLTCTVAGSVTSAQIESGGIASSWITTTGATTTRNKTELSIQTEGNWPSSGIRHKKLSWTPSGFVSGTAQCLWSIYTDADNYLALWSNGVIIYFEKRVAGVSEYVTKAQVPVVGTTYELDVFVYADNTLGLYIDGVSASAGLGSEIIVNGTFTTDTDWNKGAWTIADGLAKATGIAAFSSITTLVKPSTLVGEFYLISHDIVDYASGAVRIVTRETGGPTLLSPTKSANGTFEYTYNATKTTASYELQTTSTSTLNCDNFSVKKINNNSTTLAPVIGSTMRYGDLNGANTMNGNIKDVTISNLSAVL